MTVYVCHDKDAECGDNPNGWCNACPRKAASYIKLGREKMKYKAQPRHPNADWSSALNSLDIVDRMLIQAGYTPESTTRHHLALARSIVSAAIEAYGRSRRETRCTIPRKEDMTPEQRQQVIDALNLTPWTGGKAEYDRINAAIEFLRSETGEEVKQDQSLIMLFPMRPTFMAQVVIPRYMTQAEADRLCTFIMTLVTLNESLATDGAEVKWNG